MRALKPGGRESVKGGGRDALNGVWERRRKQRQRPLFSAAFPRIRSDCRLHTFSLLIVVSPAAEGR
jgi:hypothetical protein